MEATQNTEITNTTYTNQEEITVSSNLDSGIGNNPTCTAPIPTHTKNIQGEEKLTDADILVMVKLNEKYSHIVIGGKHKIASLKRCPTNGLTYAFEDHAQFKNYFLHKQKIQKMNMGEAWLKWQDKSFYPHGVGFYPLPDKCPEGVFNFYRGLAVQPREGDCSVYLNHVKENLCGGIEETYTYLIQWLAHMIQKPDEKPSVAILLKSVEGTGKGTMVKPILKMLGEYGAQVNGHSNLTQRFNSTIANKLFIFGDEVDLKKKDVADKLKGLISETTLQLERKGIEPEPVPNYCRFIFASNHSQVIYAGLKERRYLILEPIVSNKQHFDILHCWLNNQGAEKLLHYLKHLSLDGFDKNKAPVTKALIEEKLCSLPNIQMFIYSELIKDNPFDGQSNYNVSKMVNTFNEWCLSNNKDQISEAAQRSIVGKAFKGLGVEVYGRTDRGIGKSYRLVGNDLHESFCNLIGANKADIF